MRTIKFFFVACVSLALVVTISCSSDDDKDNNPSSSSIEGILISSSDADTQSSSSDVRQSSSSETVTSSSSVTPSSSSNEEQNDSSSSVGTDPSSNSVQASSSSATPSSSSSVIVGIGCNIEDYKTVKIGTQTWMAENLNCDVNGSVCYENDPINCTIYGRLYDWATAMNLPSDCNSTNCQVDEKHQGICPAGWHIPSDEEWTEFTDYIESSNGCEECSAKYLRSSGGEWYCDFCVGDLEHLDSYGFKALPGGTCYDTEGFCEEGGTNGKSVWWSTTESWSGYVYIRHIISYIGYVNRASGGVKGHLNSVRCIKDEE